MGLGKTVEVLTVILAHRWQWRGEREAVGENGIQTQPEDPPRNKTQWYLEAGHPVGFEGT